MNQSVPELPPPRRTPQTDESGEYILFPGAHVMSKTHIIEQSNHDFACRVVERIPEDTLYSRGGVVGEIRGLRGHKVFQQLSTDRMRLIIDQHAKLGKVRAMASGPLAGQGAIIHYTPCNRDAASIVMEAALIDDRVKEIDTIVNYPVYTADWQVASPGWTNKVYYDQPEELESVGVETDLDAIRYELEQLLIDFPWKNDCDRENFIGLLITPIVRPAIHGNVPFHLVMSPKERTGKTKLVEQVLGITIAGRKTSAMTLPPSENERDKRVLAMLINGESIWHIDNIRGFLDSPTLASLLTASEYAGRILGVSRMLRLSNRTTLVGTGNNIQATGEIVKRSIPIWLQPFDDAPEDRTKFYHPDLPKYLHEARPRVLACLLGMVRLWLDAGQPILGDKPLGGFEEWARTVGGILHVCGYHEWRKFDRTWRHEADPDGEDLRLFLQQWYEYHAEDDVPAKHLLNICKQFGLFPTTLDRRGMTDQGRTVALARTILAANVDQRIDKYFIRRRRSGSASTWRLEKVIEGKIYDAIEQRGYA